jgi:hypothetical protein
MTAAVPLSKPVVRRAAFVVHKERRRQFAEVLDYVETFHVIIDPDMFRIDLEQVTALKRRFEDDEEDTTEAVCLAFSYDELFALGLFVDATDAYCHRRTMQRGALNLTDQQLTELRDWVTRSERWFFTPLREP